MLKQQKPIILVDGSSYLYRAFHALPPLTNSAGFPTGAVYGVINMIKRLIADYQPEYMAIIFDSKGKTFRDDLYADYKATRQAMPPELVQQIEPIHQIIRAMGLPLIMVDGVEADDVIGTLAHQARERGQSTLISTGDKDLAQLVNEHVTLINTMTNTLMDPNGVVEKFGIPPALIVDYLTLVGDTSDNIPGVQKVGPKTAVKWLYEYGSLDEIVKHADKMPGKIGENLRNFLPQLPLTKKLVTIKLDVELALSMENLKIQPANKTVLFNHYKTMEFKNWLNEFLAETPKKTDDKYKNYITLTDEEAFNKALAKLAQTSVFAFDTETTSLDDMRADLVGISFSSVKGEAFYVPFAHDYQDAPKQLSKEYVLRALSPILSNPAIKKIGHNIKYDMKVLANAGIEMKGIAYDTMLESYVLDSSLPRHDMESLALKTFAWRMISYEEVAGKGVKQIPFNQVEVEKAATYAAEDADVTLQLHHALWPRIENDSALKYIFEKIEMPLIPVLAEMERNGVLIDPQLLNAHSIELETRCLQYENDAYALAGERFNINSPKQLQEILFGKLKLPVTEKTPTGQPSTADSVLQELALDYAMPRIIIEFRSLNKLISTYTHRLVEQINPKTGRIHTSYNQTGTATGRLSSSDPNLQNIPIRSPEGRRIREAFIAPKNYQLISADYSQIELRLMAHISQDAGLLHAFANNIDIHTATAAEVWGIPLSDVTPELRRNAKAINFGLIYGMSAFGLTRQLGIDRKAAQEYIDRYFARYPGVKRYMDNARHNAREKGYVETLWGRRLYLPNINATQIPRQRAAERAAINGPLQGSAADLIKMAMINIDDWLRDEGLDARLIMQVHDELVIECHEKILNEIKEGVRLRMSHVVTLAVPLVVSIGTGQNWDQASAH